MARNRQLPSPITASGTYCCSFVTSYSRRTSVAAASWFPGCASDLLARGKWMSYVASKVVSDSVQLSRRTVDTAACSLKTY